MGEAIRPLRPATVKADERHYILDMNPADAPIPQDSAPLELMTRAFEGGVGVIQKTNDFPALLAHLQQGMRPLAEACADLNPEAFELPSCQRIVARLFEPID